MGITIYQIVPIRSAPHLLMVKMNGEDAEEKVLAVVKEKSKRFKVKTRSLRGDTEEMVIELRIVKNAGDIARVVNRINEVTEVSMLAHDGEMIAQ